MPEQGDKMKRMPGKTLARTSKDDSQTLVFRTAIGSLLVQFLIGGITAASFFVPTSDFKRDDLSAILALELSSQVVEFAWYTTVVCRFARIRTWTRYIDWVISTPIMLASTALFFTHRKDEALVSILSDWRLYAMFACNWLMLAFGYALERDALGPLASLSLGGVAFVASFAILCTYADTSDSTSLGLFVAMYAVWGLYGVAAALPYTPKNVGYNVLDIVSKNFYGIFLFVYALT